MDPQREREFLDDVVDLLAPLLPWGTPGCEVLAEGRTSADAVLTVPTPTGRVDFALTVKASLTPRAAAAMPIADVPAAVGMVLACPWLSPATRRALMERGVNYLDATGNVYLRADSVPLLVTTSGAQRNPDPGRQRTSRGLSGTRAIEVVWAVTTLRPPYRMSELIEAVGGDLGAAYVSRVLRGLADDDLIQRTPRGPVEGVDIVGVIERWLESYSFMSANRPRSYIQSGTPASFLERVRTLDEPVRRRLQLTLTGPLVGHQLAPVVEPSVALAYTVDLAGTERALGLVPSRPAEGNVFLATPENRIVTDRPWQLGGLEVASPPVSAADLISLGGRNVDAGYALLEWATRHTDRWQVSVEAFPDEGRALS